MKKFEELTLEDIKVLYEEKVKREVEQEAEQEKLKEERLKRWRAVFGEDYLILDKDGDIACRTERHEKIDNYYYSIGDYFKTEKEVEDYKKKLILQQQYKDWCRFDCDWVDDNQSKVFVYYNFISKDICFGNNYRDKRQGATYAQSKERIREFIDKIGEDDFIKYILEVE